MRIIETDLNGIRDAIKKVNYIISDKNIKNLYPFLFEGKEVFALEAKEENKNIQYIESIAKDMLKKGIRRNDEIICIGGGITGDIAGFLSSIYLRGIEYSFIPTTVIAMADSAIGGKTGVNLGESKNILGSFLNAKKIYYCYDFLNTLPKEEIESGTGEIIKTALISERVFKRFNEGAGLEELIIECRKFKQKIVKKDFYDNKGIRQALNLGHTLGHAIELIYGLKHGIAVMIGLRLESIFYPKKIREWVYSKTENFATKAGDLDLKRVVFLAKTDKKNTDLINIISLKEIGKISSIMITEQQLYKELTEI